MLGVSRYIRTLGGEELDQMKEERDRLLREANAYRMEKEKAERTLLEKEKSEKTLLQKDVPMKATTRSVVELERTVKRLETEKNLLIGTHETVLSCWT